jgi:hypothetical protein
MKASNYLHFSDLEFTDYQTQTADKIYSLMAEGNLKAIGEIVNSFPSKSDGEYVHYVFLDKYEFGYEKKIHSKASGYNELKRYGLI